MRQHRCTAWWRAKSAYTLQHACPIRVAMPRRGALLRLYWGQICIPYNARGFATFALHIGLGVEAGRPNLHTLQCTPSQSYQTPARCPVAPRLGSCFLLPLRRGNLFCYLLFTKCVFLRADLMLWDFGGHTNANFFYLHAD